jgi:hypothetical protein
VPLRRPPDDNDNPDGIVPVCTAKDTEFVAVNWREYADPAATSAKAPAEVVQTGRGTVVCVNVLSAKMTIDVVLSKRTVKLYDAAAVGVPLSTPEVDKDVPAARVPDSNE